MIGNEEDFTACLGFAVPGHRRLDLDELETANFQAMIGAVTKEYPQLPGRRHHAAHGPPRHRQRLGRDRLVATAGFVEATHRPGLEILDRVGGGDSFASGLIYGLLTGSDLHTAVEYGAAHGALAMTTPGDTSMASLAEVEALVRGAGARVQR